MKSRRPRTKDGDDMSEAVIVALISSSVTIIGVILANLKNAAVMETRIDELTREVREHNEFAKRMPVVEEKIKVINKRIDALEDKAR